MTFEITSATCRIISRGVKLILLPYLALVAAFPARGATLQSRLAGNDAHDFTLVYSCNRRVKLQHATREDIAAMVGKSYAAMSRHYEEAHMKVAPLPADAVETKTNEIMRELQDAGSAVLTISQRGRLLLVKVEFPTRKVMKLSALVYDGKRSLFTYRGSDAQITPGFDYVDLRYFIFPGFGVDNVAMGKDLAPASAGPDVYRAQIALNDGIADTDGVAYAPGTIRTHGIDGTECVTETVARRPDTDGYQERCSYTGYRSVGPQLLIPGSIHLSKWYRLGSVLEYGEQATLDYTLQSASDKSLPESEFKFETQLPEEALVRTSRVGKTETVRYVPGKSLDEQIKADAEDKRVAELAATPESVKHPETRYIAILATVLAICAWYLYRRALSRSNGEGR